MSDTIENLERDLGRLKATLATVIPALEAATGIKADELIGYPPEGDDKDLTRDEWAALLMSQFIMEGLRP